MADRGSVLLRLTRFLFRIPKPRVSRDQALEIATQAMLGLGWTREATAPVLEHLREWEVWGLDALHCSNMIVLIDMRTGKYRVLGGPGQVGGGQDS